MNPEHINEALDTRIFISILSNDSFNINGLILNFFASMNLIHFHSLIDGWKNFLTMNMHYIDELWKQNAIKKVKRAREVAKKIQACINIQRMVVE
ncbi:hypothetical protein Glove_157g10 [Diversispora epigaea]|uniref:Uncharacterized protein n=1 Tax=Diversispora epigaea TaxID=1348612 RepID=A0A397IRX3_9GLOM|nr:hypothetical protein Glove_157g10 [Diversispora epigaea]